MGFRLKVESNILVKSCKNFQIISFDQGKFIDNSTLYDKNKDGICLGLCSLFSIYLLIKEKNYLNSKDYITKFVNNIYKDDFSKLVNKIHKIQTKSIKICDQHIEYYNENKELFQKGALLNSISINSELNNPNIKHNIIHYFRKKLIEGNTLVEEHLKPAKGKWELNKIGMSTETNIIDVINNLSDIIEKKILNSNNNENFTLLILPSHAVCLNYYKSIQTNYYHFIFFDPNFGFYKFESKDQKGIPNSLIAFLSNILCYYCLDEDGYEKKSNLVCFYDFNYVKK